jgi:peptidoglycan-associated lipoprotein
MKLGFFNKKVALVLAALLMAIAIAGCSKKVARAPSPSPPPAPPAPTATLTVSLPAIEKGRSTVLNWNTQNADDVTIDALGMVSASGSREVQPGESITYQLSATGPGGTADASARVTVTSPPPANPPPAESEADLFAQNVKDIYYAFDDYDLRSDQEQTAQSDAQFLASHPNIQLSIEGHCDDRGSDEYNLGLGDSRAETVKNYLVRSGVSAGRIHIISYGKEHPFCTEDNDQCWRENRRAHFVFLEQSAQMQ